MVRRTGGANQTTWPVTVAVERVGICEGGACGAVFLITNAPVSTAAPSRSNTHLFGDLVCALIRMVACDEDLTFKNPEKFGHIDIVERRTPGIKGVKPLLAVERCANLARKTCLEK